MISAASTAARLRTPAAGVGAAMMLPERPSGPLGRGKVAFAVPGAPGLRAKPHFGASASVVGASWPLSTLSTSSSPPSSRRSRSVTARAASSPAPFPTSSREPALGILAPGPDEDAWRPGDPITPFMENRKRWLMEDLPHLFDDIGIDKSGYADVVEFRDPITSYNSLSGYLFNIAALRRVFSPTFVLLDVKQTAPRDLTTRWAMEMTVAGGGVIPAPLRPKLAFTGTSILTFDGKGKICKHFDTWDALAKGREQEYFSVAGFRNVLGQLADVRKPPAEPSPSTPAPSLWSPPRQLLRKTAAYEIRRYDDLAVIEAPMGSEGGVTGPGARSAFRALAGFIGRQEISMTTPVLSDSRAMRFVLSPGEAEARAKAAASSSPGDVAVSRVKGGIYAVRSFGGIATDASSAEAAARLKSDLAADGVKVAGEGSGSPFLLAQYNGPVTLPPFRLNEVLVLLDEDAFDLWRV